MSEYMVATASWLSEHTAPIPLPTDSDLVERLRQNSQPLLRHVCGLTPERSRLRQLLQAISHPKSYYAHLSKEEKKQLRAEVLAYAEENGISFRPRLVKPEAIVREAVEDDELEGELDKIRSSPRYQDSLGLDEPQGHYQMLHASQRGTVIVWERRDSGNDWHKLEPDQASNEVQSFLQGLTGHVDTYFSVNEFLGWRLTRLLKSLRANYVDLDFGRPATKADMDDALDALRSQELPWPNLAVFTGRGLHFYWIMTHTPAQALPVWQAVQATLIDALRDHHVDPKARDCTRFLRAIGTVNSKTKAEVRGVVLSGIPWSFRRLTDAVLGERIVKPRNVRSLDAKRAQVGEHPRSTIYRRWHLVLNDLHKIGRHYGQIPEGHRNEYLFISSVALSWFASPDSIEDEVVEMARLYCPGIEQSEAVMAASQSIQRAVEAGKGVTRNWQGQERDPRYVFKRKTLWERLEDLAAPIKHNLRAIIPDEISEQREAERQKNRDRVAEGRYTAHYTGKGVRADNLDKVEIARRLVAEGRSIRSIAREVDVSEGAVRKWLKGAY